MNWGISRITESLPEGRALGDDPGLLPGELLDSLAPEEAMVLHALFPEVLAFVSPVKKELHNILVIALQVSKSQ